MGALPALIISFFLLMLNAFFVAVEFALLASRRARLNQLVESGRKTAVRASKSLGELTVMLAGAQLGITVCSFGLGALAEPAIADGIAGFLHRPIHIPAGIAHGIAFLIALVIVVFIHMIIGEMAPKSWAITHPEKSAMALITPFRAFTSVVRPLLVGLNSIANGIIRLFGVTPRGEVSMALSSAELSVLLQRSQEHGVLDTSTLALLTRSLSLSRSVASDAFTARHEITTVSADADADAIEACARQSGLSRILVTDGSLDRVVGQLLVRDVLVLGDDERANVTARQLARPVTRHRSDRRIEDILVAARSQHHQLVVITDASGRTAGVLTIQDIVDQLLSGQPGSQGTGD
jgi:CBS domain containing-hemolysin-like protein